MNLQDFRTLCAAESFKPFVMHLANGKEILVDHPDFVLLPRTGYTVAVLTSDNRLQYVDLLLVNSLETDGLPGGELPNHPEQPEPGRRE